MINMYTIIGCYIPPGLVAWQDRNSGYVTRNSNRENIRIEDRGIGYGSDLQSPVERPIAVQASIRARARSSSNLPAYRQASTVYPEDHAVRRLERPRRGCVLAKS